MSADVPQQAGEYRVFPGAKDEFWALLVRDEGRRLVLRRKDSGEEVVVWRDQARPVPTFGGHAGVPQQRGER